MILALPNELLLLLVKELGSSQDINNLVLANRRFHALLNTFLYRFNVQQCNSSGILWAAENGQENTAQRLLKEGANTHMKTTSNETPLHLAAKNGHQRLVRLLLSFENVDSQVKDTQQHTPLMWAARNGHSGVVNMLVQTRECNINSLDSMGYSPLAWAARNGHVAVVELLLHMKTIEPNSLDRFRHTPLSWAARNGHEVVLKRLLDHPGIDVNIMDINQRNPLSWAMQHSHRTVVKLLLAKIQDRRTLETPPAMYRWHGQNGTTETTQKLLPSIHSPVRIEQMGMGKVHYHGP